MTLTVDQLLASRPFVREVVLKDRDGSVNVRPLPAGEALTFHNALKAAGEDSKELVVLQLVAYLSNADGSALVNAEQAAQLVDVLSQRDIAAILSAGAEVNRIDDKTVEDAAKN